MYSEVADSYPIAKYLYSYDDYSLMDYIEVISKDKPDRIFAFVAFQSNSTPLDSVKVAELDKTDKVICYTNLKFDDLDFVFVKNVNGKKEVIDSIEVAL
ncbi:MAG TPA: hypothetical protein PKC39_11295 [Ferruginibacter sp.]|nr:hypothetical protein [Ferruginibacter sp.]HMP21534.1 hypothetical protein [Ferruginibacter sp.]